MNDRYADIKSRILELARTDYHIRAVVMIGSSTRNDIKADDYSDLDLIIASEDTESWLYGGIPELLGDLRISFVEPTLGGGTERRVLYGNALDVDMIIFTPEQFEAAARDGVAGWVCDRGYSVLYDSMNITGLLAEYVSSEIQPPDMTESEYVNLVNDFCFHTVWASKKLLRGELWSAKMCIDAYLKNYLLRMIEMYSAHKYGVDVWHSGRFLDTWAEDRIKRSLPACFAHYDRKDMISALLETKKMFTELAEQVAVIKGFKFPETAVRYSGELLQEWFGSTE